MTSTGPILEVSPEFRTTAQAAAQKVAASPIFRRSPRLRDLFQYIVEASLESRLEDLTENRIAEVVFQRKDYNSAEGNIVRVSVRQLRSKLAEYYDTESSGEDMVIEIPKGAYVASFHARERAPEPVPVPAVQPPRHTTWMLLPWALCIVLLAGVVILWLHLPAPLPPTLFDVLYPSADQPQRIEFVTTDSALILYENLAQRDIPVEEYASPRYMGDPGLPTTPAFLQLLRGRQISSLADFRILAQLMKNPRYARDIGVRHAKNLHARDFDSDDSFFLLGTSRSNPWVSLYSRTLPFHWTFHNGEPCFANTHPQPGEQELYCSEDSANEQGTSYGRISVVHNPSHRGRVLMIGGTDMEGTEAAGSFFLNPQSVSTVLHALKVDSIRALPDFEILLKTYSVGGAGRAQQIVATRKM